MARTATGAGGSQPDKALKPLVPWFGAKTKVAPEVWRRFGNPSNYVEPFAGSMAVLLGRPDTHQWWTSTGLETVNDADGFIPNFYRAIAADPELVAHHASWPVNEADLTARHLWLVQHRPDLTAALMRDPDFYDARAAGWWAWGICAWVGGDWCTGIGPFTGTDAKPISQGGTAPGVYRKVPMIAGGHGGKGLHKPRDVGGVTRSISGGLVPDVTGSTEASIAADFAVLANRLRRVRIACGNWDRVLGQGAVAAKGHLTAVFLDPPYDPGERRGDLYGVGDRPDSLPVHLAARAWALARTNQEQFRIAYCSYSTDAEDALFTEAGWSPYRWNASGGYGLTGENRARTNKDREVIWFSPSCLNPTPDPDAAPTAAQPPLSLFDAPVDASTKAQAA